MAFANNFKFLLYFFKVQHFQCFNAWYRCGVRFLSTPHLFKCVFFFFSTDLKRICCEWMNGGDHWSASTMKQINIINRKRMTETRKKNPEPEPLKLYIAKQSQQ